MPAGVECSVLIVGAGGLGTPALLALCDASRTDSFKITVVEHDAVDVSNLNRQFLYTADDVGRPKTDVLERRRSELGFEFDIVDGKVADDERWLERFRGFSLVLDCTDSVRVKYEINSLCVKARVPLVHAAVQGWEGQVMAIRPGVTACYRCLFRELPTEGDIQTPPEAGIMGAMSGFVGLMQARRGLSMLWGDTDGSVEGRISLYDMRRQRIRTVPVERWDACPVCGGGVS